MATGLHLEERQAKYADTKILRQKRDASNEHQDRSGKSNHKDPNRENPSHQNSIGQSFYQSFFNQGFVHQSFFNRRFIERSFFKQAASGQNRPPRSHRARALAAGESHRHPGARKPSGASGPGRSGSRWSAWSVRRRGQVQPGETGGFFELRQTSY